MKRLLTIMTLLMATVVSGLAADKTVYLKPDAKWLSNNARFAVYMFNSDTDNAWADFTLVEGEENLYQATVPEQYANIIACRMNGDPSSTENKWGNRAHQTADIMNVKDQAIITITSDKTNEWGTFELGTYIKSVKLMGSFDQWSNGLTMSTQLPGNTVSTWTHSWYTLLDLNQIFGSQQLKLLVNDRLWLGFGEIGLGHDATDLLSDAGENDHNFLLDNVYRDYEVYVGCDEYYQKLTFSILASNHTKRPSAITEVRLVLQPGATDQEWSIPMERQGDDANTFSYAGTLDLTKYAQNPCLALRVTTADGNSSLLKGSTVALSESSLKGLKKEQEGDNTNILLTHRTTGYSNYTVTTSWNTSSNTADEGWTLGIQGKDKRKYYIVGELTGGWPESDDDESKDQEMEEVDWFNSNDRIGEKLTYNYFVGKKGETYEYKLRTNKVWGLCDFPEVGNEKWTCPDDGVYSLQILALIKDDANAFVHEGFGFENNLKVDKAEKALTSVGFEYDEYDVDDEPDVLKLTQTALTKTNSKIEYTGYIDVEGSNKDFNLSLKINGTALGNPNADVIHCYSHTQGLIIGTADGFRLMHAQFCHLNKSYKVTISWDTTSKDIKKGWTVVVDVDETYPQTHIEATFVNGEGWDEVYAYTWSVEADGNPDEGSLQLGAWPGKKLEKKSVKTEQGLDFDVYGFEKDTELGFPSYIIFNNGKSQEEGLIKTEDLPFTNFNEYTQTMPVGTYVWTSNEARPFTADSEKRLEVAPEKFANAKVGDKLHVYLSGVMTNKESQYLQWVQMAIDNYDYLRLLEGQAFVASTTAVPTREATFVLTGDILAYLKHNKVSLRSYGSVENGGCKTRVVTLESVGTEAAGSMKSVWVGTPSSHVTVSTVHFNNANNFTGIQVGDVIRLTTDSPVSVDASIKYQHYGEASAAFADGSFQQSVSGTLVEFKVLTAEAADILNRRSLYPELNDILFDVTGANITQVEVIPSTGYYVISDCNGEWKIYGEDLMEIDEEGCYSKIINTEAAGGSMANKYFAIAPSTALNADGTVARWDKVVRPKNTESNFLVEYFRDYSAETSTGEHNYVWLVAQDNNAELQLQYIPSRSQFNINSLARDVVTISPDLGYATYSNAAPYEIAPFEDRTYPDIYIVKEVGTSVKLFKMKDLFFMPGGVGKGAGIILHKAGGATVTIKPTSVPFFADADNNLTTFADSQASFVQQNLLAGSGNSSYVITGKFSDTDTYVPYVLDNGGEGFGFYQVDPNSYVLAAHNAFLAAPQASSTGFFGFDEMTTSLDEELRVENEEFATAPVYYDLSGRRVENPTKGIYIVNGKKVVVK